MSAKNIVRVAAFAVVMAIAMPAKSNSIATDSTQPASATDMKEIRGQQMLQRCRGTRLCRGWIRRRTVSLRRAMQSTPPTIQLPRESESSIQARHAKGENSDLRLGPPLAAKLRAVAVAVSDRVWSSTSFAARERRTFVSGRFGWSHRTISVHTFPSCSSSDIR